MTRSCKSLVRSFYEQMNLIKEYTDQLAIEAIERDKGMKIEDYLADKLKNVDPDESPYVYKYGTK
jgi:hypothetical protein